MTEEGGVHGSQRVKESAPGFVTFRVIGDNMFGQSSQLVCPGQLYRTEDICWVISDTGDRTCRQ